MTPAENTAADRLERLLYLLPAAAAQEGATWAELREPLGVPEEVLAADVTAVRDRAFYHPSGGAESLQITLEPARVRVWSGGEFRRPPRLSLREMLALELGLRVVASDAPPDTRERLARLARQLAREIAARDADPAELLPRFSLVDGDGDEDDVRALLVGAARERRRCRIRYLKPGADAPEERTIDPWAVCHARGRWYVIGRSERADDVRHFRVDRVLEAEQLYESFPPPEGFDPSDHLEGGRVYRAEEDEEVVVRYSPRIARWILERGRGVEEPDGSVVVGHRVADPGWMVRHVLRYGEDAEILEPAWARGMVRERARELAAERPEGDP